MLTLLILSITVLSQSIMSYCMSEE